MLRSAPDGNVIPQIYNHLKMSFQQSRHDVNPDNGNARAPIVVYGLATAYSSSLIVVLLSVVLVAVLLLGDGAAPSVLLMCVVLFALLELAACYARTGGVEGSLFSIVAIFLLGSEHFFSTGHQATISGIRWEAAFHGFQGNFASNVIPAMLITLNSFASHLICSVALPLVVFWPLTRGRCVAESKEEGESKGELIMSENKSRLRHALFKVYTRYVLLYGLKLLATMACVSVHRRHLMVWKIFAPRFVYEAATFLFISLVSFLVSLFVLRVDRCLNKWISKL